MELPDVITPPVAMLLELWNIEAPAELRAVGELLARRLTALGSVCVVQEGVSKSEQK